MLIERRPPTLEELSRSLAARMARDGIPAEQRPSPAAPPKSEDRRQRSLRSCHLPAEPKRRHAPPRDSSAYVPEMAARIDNDPNLTDGARRCARKLAEIPIAHARGTRLAQITVTYLMKALGKSRRTVQRYLRQLERAGYICVEIIHASTRMCAGIVRHAAGHAVSEASPDKWPAKLTNSDASRVVNRTIDSE